MKALQIHGLKEKILGTYSMLLYIYEHNLFPILIMGTVCYTPVLFVAISSFIVGGGAIPLLIIFGSLMCHAVLYSKASSNAIKRESEPYQTLRSLDVGGKITYCSFAVLVGSSATMMVMGLAKFDYTQDLYISSILVLPFMISITLLIVLAASLFYLSSILSSHKESRLCFQIILSILNGAASQPEAERKFVAKNASFFRGAFYSLRTFLVGKPFALELKNIDDYYTVVYTAAVVGNKEEIEQVSEKTRSILDAMGVRAKDMRLRDLLSVLVRLIQPEQEVTGLEISKLCKVSRRLERIKSKLVSPITSPTVAIIAVIVTIIFRVIDLLI